MLETIVLENGTAVQYSQNGHPSYDEEANAPGWVALVAVPLFPGCPLIRLLPIAADVDREECIRLACEWIFSIDGAPGTQDLRLDVLPSDAPPIEVVKKQVEGVRASLRLG